MQLIHNGIAYDCAYAVKCTNDCYIKLYDANGVEIMSFNDISDFSQFALSGGSFIYPYNCAMPIPLTTYSIGGRTITPDDWKILADGRYCHEIESDLISGNETTCNILLLFAENTDLEYEAKQSEGKIILYVETKPTSDISINGIHVTRT